MRFADAFYFLALLNRNDAAHAGAVRLAADLGSRLVTTDRVVVEVAEALTVDRHFEQAGFRALLREG